MHLMLAQECCAMTGKYTHKKTGTMQEQTYVRSQLVADVLSHSGDNSVLM